MKNTEFVYYTLAIDRKADLLFTRDINLLEFFFIELVIPWLADTSSMVN